MTQNGLVVRTKNSRSTYILLIGVRLYFYAITLCLMALFLAGYLIFILASSLTLFVLLALYMVSKLAVLSMRLRRGMALALKGRKY